MQDEVKVSQADIEAVRHFYNNSSANLTGQELVELEQAFARHRHQAERDTLARMEWRDIESAPRDKYFLAVIDAGETERRLLHALGLADDLADYREIHIAYRRKGDPKRKIRTSPHGRIYTATHWMNLPELPEN